jgi:hypothetical protein
MLISNLIFLKKYIILIYFQLKNTLKINLLPHFLSKVEIPLLAPTIGPLSNLLHGFWNWQTLDFFARATL